jgi:formyltetrahydrofolate-dependent phosphoribosylglycinamide formyltransferase
MTRKKTAVLISGRGSNMAALIAAALKPDYPAEIVLVVSDNPAAAGLAKARDAGVTAEAVDRSVFPGKAAFEEALQQRLEAVEAELVCLAGFMRVLSAGFVARWQDRLLNIHPSILPAFRGIDTHQRALDAGVRVHGCTVHFVRADVDAGPIIAQAIVPVLARDTADTLSARLLPVEHRVYPMALALVASGRARVAGDKVVIDNAPDQGGDRLIVPDMPEA